MNHESLQVPATVKGTMLAAHLEWARERFGDLGKVLVPHLSPDAGKLVSRGVFATDWIPLVLLVEIDKAIAMQAGGDPTDTYLELGRHSASQNLSGVYKSFVSSEPHRFFEESSVLHERFQSFGRLVYERTGERSGRMRMEDYKVFSPSYCASGRGYFEEALRLMHAPGPVVVAEHSCQCRGDAACVYDIRW